MFAEVLVEYNNKSIDKSFLYKVPLRYKDSINNGVRVKVPFGKKIINGIVINLLSIIEVDYELKEIIEVINEEIYLNNELLELGKYLQEKTLCTRIMAYQTMFPTSLKIKNQKNNYMKYVSYARINSLKKIEDYISKYPKRHKQIEIINKIKDEGRVLSSSIPSSILKILKDEEIIDIEKEQVYRINQNEGIINKKIEFSDEQLNALNTIDIKKEEIYLLHGVTGSGKTEVYIQLIRNVLKNNKKALMLVPEISLTTQVVKYFYDLFGNDVAVFHSGLSLGEKNDEYIKIYRGEVKVVIGTRSAIFAPLDNLGIIIVDEEHSETYKQDTNPRYNAIDMAVFRMHYNHIPLVLGSATPSLESMARAQKKVYKYIRMSKRIGRSILPSISLVDMNKEVKKNFYFSNVLISKIKDRIAKNQQVIIFLNRRGFSSVISCKSCGFTYKCPNCDITLTYHKRENHLRCHYCGYAIVKRDCCPKCNEKSLSFLGIGTEKVEDELNKIIPGVRIVRMDADTTSRKGEHQRIIDEFYNHKYDVLVGTQMISKGLNFPLVTLVGVLNADTSLNIPDFRSGERTFSLLSQISGRAGRSDLLGEVIIQTFNPDDFILRCVKDNNYLKFYNYEMNNRHKLDYPPYYFITLVKISSSDYDLASKEIIKVKNYLINNINAKIILLGPTTSAMFKINNIYRFQIILKYKEVGNLFDVLKGIDNIYSMNKRVNFEIDNNPLQI